MVFAIPLKASASNVIQIVYTVLNFLLVITPLFLPRKYQHRQSYFSSASPLAPAFLLFWGFIRSLVSSLGYLWPNTIINSNLGVTQLEEQTMIGMRRMSATFLEPSMLSLHFPSSVWCPHARQAPSTNGLMCAWRYSSSRHLQQHTLAW